MEKDTQTQQQEAPPTVGDSIRAAMEEHKVEEAKISEKESRKEEPKTEIKQEVKSEVKEEPKTEIKPEVKPEVKTEAKTEEIKEVKSEETKEEKKPVKVPFGLPKDIRAEWEKLSPSTQNYLSKIVKENLDTKAAEGRRSHMREVEQVLSPYMPEIQRLGVPPAAVVKRMLDYTDALANPQQKYAAIHHLATSYGIDLSLFGREDQNQDQNQNQNQQNQQQQTIVNIPPELDNKLNRIIDRQDKFESAQVNSQRAANDKAALDYVNSWSGYDPATGEYSKKPYFSHVRQSMFDLIANGTIPLVNGQIDMDRAYETACFLNSDVRELMAEDQQKEFAKSQQSLQETKQQVVVKARNAGSSLRSGAPVPAVRTQQNSNRPNKNESARESIMRAFAEVNR